MNARAILTLPHLLTGAVAALLLTGCGGTNLLALEQPSYTVEFETDDLEFRRYAPYLVAETVVDGSLDYNEAANRGFERLFNYISGENQARQKIAMTAPVQQSAAGESIAMTAPVQQTAAARGWVISFMLPSKYTLESAPVPRDEQVTVRQVEGELFAVLRYSGRWTPANFNRHRSALLAKLDETGIAPQGAVVSAVYNPPFMPPFLRRNEVMVAVDRVPQTPQISGVTGSAE